MLIDLLLVYIFLTDLFILFLVNKEFYTFLFVILSICSKFFHQSVFLYSKFIKIGYIHYNNTLGFSILSVLHQIKSRRL